MSRRALIEARISARTDANGKALPGYARNVAALKAELARIQDAEKLGGSGKDPAP